MAIYQVGVSTGSSERCPSSGCVPCRRYVRRNIGKYLDQHINMPPAAVLVTAVLRTQVQGSPSTDLGLHEVQPSTPSSSTGAAGDGGSSSSSGSAQAADAAPQAATDHPLTRLLLGCFSWLTKPNAPDAAAAASVSASSSTDGAAASKQPTTASHGTTASSSGSADTDGDSSSPADAYAVVDAVSSTGRSAPAAASGTSSSDGASNGPNVAALVGSALQRLSDSVPQLRLQQKAGQTHVVETLVGVAEVSFQERTRSQALTLNPPQVRAGSLLTPGHSCVPLKLKSYMCLQKQVQAKCQLLLGQHLLWRWWWWRQQGKGILVVAAAERPTLWVTACCPAEVRLPVQHGSCKAVAAQGHRRHAYDGHRRLVPAGR